MPAVFSYHPVLAPEKKKGMKVYVGDEDSGCGSVPRSSMVLAVQLLRMDLGEFLCIDPAEKLVNRGLSMVRC